MGVKFSSEYTFDTSSDLCTLKLSIKRAIGLLPFLSASIRKNSIKPYESIDFSFIREHSKPSSSLMPATKACVFTLIRCSGMDTLM